MGRRIVATLDQLAAALTRLRLEPGDILLVDTDVIDIVQLCDVRLPISFDVPMFPCPEGGIVKFTRKDLLSLLAQLPEEVADA